LRRMVCVRVRIRMPGVGGVPGVRGNPVRQL
jgi:hypothetical protein